jgi:hypothetical protein
MARASGINSSPQRPPTDQPRLIVVGPEINGAGVGSLNGDHGNLSFEGLRGDDRRDVLLSLELEYKVDAFLDQHQITDSRICLTCILSYHTMITAGRLFVHHERGTKNDVER